MNEDSDLRRRAFDLLPTLWLAAVLAAWVVWAWDASLGWPVALAAAPGVAWLVSGRVSLRPAALTLGLVLFLLAMGAGLWAGYDRDGSLAVFSNPIGRQKVWGILLAVELYFALAAAATPGALRRALALLTGLGAAVALVFAATHDWAAAPSSVGAITWLGQALQAPLPELPRGLLNDNVVGGITAPLLPLAGGLLVRSPRPWRVWGLLTGLALALGVLLSTSRGAWIGVAGAMALAAAWILAGRLARPARRAAIFAALAGVGGLALALALALVPAVRAPLVGSADAQNRLHIYEQALLVVREFPYTGSGLGTFPLLHSTYALLIHVPILPHAHGLLVDVALEQGVFGLLGALLAWGAAAVVGVRALAGREEVLDRPILAAGLLSLAVLVLHGLVDDALYGSRGLLLLWAPAGVVVAAAGRRARMPLGRVGWWLLPGLALAAVLGVLLYGPSLVAAGYANLGAVRQARAELARYDYRHFDQPTLDELRAGLDLSQAVAAYEQALAWEYGQPVARTRLAQLALARGRYAEALTHAEAAWEAGHRDRVVRLIYGDALVANGHVEQGAAVVEGLVWASSRLQGQAFYRYWRGQDWQRAAYAWQAALILEPENEHVRSQAEAAAERAAQE